MSCNSNIVLSKRREERKTLWRKSLWRTSLWRTSLWRTSLHSTCSAWRKNNTLLYNSTLRTKKPNKHNTNRLQPTTKPQTPRTLPKRRESQLLSWAKASAWNWRLLHASASARSTQNGAPWLLQTTGSTPLWPSTRRVSWKLKWL